MEVYINLENLEDITDNALLKISRNNAKPEIVELVKLKSIADHDKEIKKQIVKQVLDFIEKYKIYYFEQGNYYGVECIFFNRSNLEKDILKKI